MAKSKFRTALEEAMDKVSTKVRSTTSSFQDNFNRGYDNFKQQQKQSSTQRRQDYSNFQNKIVNRVRSEAPRIANRVTTPIREFNNRIESSIPGGYEGAKQRVTESGVLNPFKQLKGFNRSLSKGFK